MLRGVSHSSSASVCCSNITVQEQKHLQYPIAEHEEHGKDQRDLENFATVLFEQ